MNEELSRKIRQATFDPGAFVPREFEDEPDVHEYEPLWRWQARAVEEVLKNEAPEKVFYAEYIDWESSPPDCIERIGVFSSLEGAVAAAGVYDEHYQAEKGRKYVAAPYEREDGVYLVFPEGEPPKEPELHRLWIGEETLRP